MVWLFLFIIVSEKIDSILDKQDFVIVPGVSRNIYDLYERCKKYNEPILVTKDLVLHTMHKLFNYSLRIIEIEELLPKIKILTEKMINEIKIKLDKEKNKNMLTAYINNLIFFGVAGELLDIDLTNIPTEVKEKIDAEITLINECSGIHQSPLFGYYEDYTQYIPRGHYTRNYDFRQYFKGMMWYGRLGFYINPNKTMYPTDIDTLKEAIKLTRMALIITRIMEENKELLNLWQEIYKPITYFVGKTDALTIEDYIKIMKKLKIKKIEADCCVLKFIREAKKFAKTKAYITADTKNIPISFRFMGQRFIPDSYIMQNLVYPKVKKYLGEKMPFTCEITPLGKIRCFPRGLDVMYVLGSDLAGKILKEEGDTEYEDYDKQISKLKSEFDNLTQQQWKENLYWRWLYILKSILNYNHSEKAPKFMRTNLWKIKELNTALGSWTELRHDVLLYGKQSYTAFTTALPKELELTNGWIEPYPEIYEYINKFIHELIKTYKYPKEVEDKMKEFAEIMNKFAIIAKKELEGKSLTEMEDRLIWNIGTHMRSIIQFSPSIMKKIAAEADEDMAIIADVHTDPNSQKVLQEAVGYPDIIYAKLPDGRIVKGGVFSYYEFKSPIAQRYTGEKWQEKVRTRPPEKHKWFIPIFSTP